MKSARILVVDDSEMNRDTLQGLVEALGHQPVLVESGQQALEVMRMPQSVDLLLLDLLMPGLSGYEVLQQVKQDNGLRDIPVIMVSVVDELESVLQCIEAGADDYLIKPFNALLLKARINSCLQKKMHADKEKKFNSWLAESYQKLQQAEEARDSLFKMIVHDMKNPLTTILGEAELSIMRLENGKFEQDKGVRSLENIQTSARQINSLVRGILDVAKLEANQFVLELTKVNMVEEVEEQLSLVNADLQAQSIAVHLVADEEQEMNCLADRALLKRIIQNLLGNSLKYGCSSDKPLLVVSIERQEEVTLAISDNGPGIEKEHLPHIFSKFFQADRKQQGLGLGLSFCRMAVLAMNGRITAENNPAGGCTFKVRLPAA